MTDTVQTTAKLLNPIFADLPVVENRITPQNMRDFVVSFDVTRQAVINVKDAPYLAKGDGVTDDTAAIQGAINTGVPALLPPNATFKTSSSLTVGLGQALIGSGLTSIIAASSVSGPAVIVGTNSRVLNASGNMVVGGFRIRGTATEGVRTKGATDTRVENISLNGLTATNGFVFDTVFGCSFQNLWTDGATISGSCFITGENYNANKASHWYTSNFCTNNFLFDATFESGNGTAHGSEWAMLTAQGGNVGIWVRAYQAGVLNGVYNENVRLPIKFGDSSTSTLARAIKVNGIDLGGPQASHPDVANRVAAIDFSYCRGISIDGADFSGVFNCGTWAPVTFSGGGGSGARAIARVTPAGAVSSVEVLNPGTGYTSDPTVAFGGEGANATGTVTRSGTTVLSVAVNTGGTGYAIASGLPVAIVYTTANRVSLNGWYFNSSLGLNSPLYPWIVRSATADSAGGITLLDDQSWRSSDNANCAEVRKTRGFGFKHALIEWDVSGVVQTYIYIPPVFP